VVLGKQPRIVANPVGFGYIVSVGLIKNKEAFYASPFKTDNRVRDFS